MYSVVYSSLGLGFFVYYFIDYYYFIDWGVIYYQNELCGVVKVCSCTVVSICKIYCSPYSEKNPEVVIYCSAIVLQ